MDVITKIKFKKYGGRNRTRRPEFVTPKIGQDPYYLIILYTKDADPPRYIGELAIIKTKFGFWETHCCIESKYQGQGLGVMFYRRAFKLALKKGLDLRSSIKQRMTYKAKRLWKSTTLRDEFNIFRVGQRYKVEL